MATNKAVRDMLNDAFTTIAREAPTYVHVGAWRAALDNMSDDVLVQAVGAALTPHAAAIRASDVAGLAAAFPGYELGKLAGMLPAETTRGIFHDLGMLVMLLSTMSIIPAEMRSSIEGFATQMSQGMQNGNMPDLTSMLGSMLGGGALSTADELAVPSARRKKRSRKRLPAPTGSASSSTTPSSAQARFREKLV